MTTIKATCPVCGEVELTAAALQLVVCSLAELSYYAFYCPECTDEVRKPADERIISLLVSGGVTPTHWEIPAEAMESKPGPALTYDDLLDFALQLGETDHLALYAQSSLPA